MTKQPVCVSAALVLQVSKFLLALDQSTQTTGYAIFQDSKLLTYGHIDPTGEYIERIAKLRKWASSVCDSLDDELEIAIEDIQLQEFEPNGGKRVSKDFGVTTFKKLAHVQGALLSLFAERKIKYHIVSSNSWKSLCKIQGRRRDEQKRNAQQFVIDTYEIKPTQDEADAICIGHYVLKTQSASTGINWL